MPYAAAYRRRLLLRLGRAGLPAFLVVHPELADAAGRARAYRRLRAVVVTWGETRLAKLSCQAEGAFGKFSPALAWGHEQMVATKTLRLFPRRQGGSTAPTDLDRALRERDHLRRFYSPEVSLLHDPRANKMLLIMPLAVATLVPDRSRPPRLQGWLVRSAMRQLAHQLQDMHDHGVAHCDVKPANTFIGRDGTLRAGDMGKASPSHRPVPGTLAYAAPELLCRAGGAEQPPDGRVDIWSLGVTLLDALVPIRGRLFSPPQAFALVGEHARFEAWRGNLSRAARGGPTALVRALAGPAGGGPVGGYFRELAALDAELCYFVLDRMLVPAARRAGPAPVARFAARLQGPDSPQEAQARAALAHHAGAPRMRAVRLALEERLRDELMGEAMAVARAVVPHLVPSLRFAEETFDDPAAPPEALTDPFFAALAVAAPALHRLLMRRVFVSAPDLTLAELAAAGAAARRRPSPPPGGS